MPLSDDPRRLVPDAYPHQLRYQTRFGDMDFNRHLNNVAVAQVYEEGRVRFSSDWRRAHPDIRGVRFLVAHVGIDYLAEALYPDELLVGTAILQLGRSSYRFGQGLFQTGRCVGLADSVLVYRDDNGPAPLPDAVRAVLRGYPLA